MNRKSFSLHAALLVLLISMCCYASQPPIDEEVFYPVPLGTPSAILTDLQDASPANLLSQLSSSPRTESPGLWEPHLDQAGGRSEVMAAVTRALMTSDRYCARRSTFETGVCRIAREESLERAARARLRSRDGRFQFVPREIERVKLIFKRTKRALFEVIQSDGRFSKEEKARLVRPIVGIEISENSFLTDLSLIKDESERAVIRSRCLDASGAFLLDNSYLQKDRITLCPFHVAKAFATADEGRPEEIMILNLAHLLAHALDFDDEKASACYATHFAGIGDTYGLRQPGTFGKDSEVLCCCATPPGESGIRGCLDTRGCAAKGSSSSCDIRGYMPELAADQWAYSTLGQYIKREQDYALGKVKRTPEFITRQNRDLFSKNMYGYCDPEHARREDRAALDPANLFINPKDGFRISEARKNRILAGSIDCPFETEALTREFGPACWSSKADSRPARKKKSKREHRG